MKRRTLAALFSFGLFATLAAPAASQTGINEQEAHAIGVNAYLYFYPLLSLDLTRRQSTNIEPGKEVGKGPMNAFSSFPAFPSADNKLVVRFNFDTLYSPAWLDLTKSRWSFPRRIPMADITCCQCWICGPTYLHRPVGARRALRRETSSSLRPTGTEPFLRE